MDGDIEQIIQRQRNPVTRNDMRGTKSRYHWLPGIVPFQEIKKEIHSPSRKKKKKKKKYNPDFDMKADAYMVGVNTLIFKQTLAKKLQINFLDTVEAHFRDEKENLWFLALNPQTLNNDELNDRLKLNFTLNKQKNHTKTDLLLAVCSSEFFLYFSNKLWEMDMVSNLKLYKLLEIFIFTMTYINHGDFLNDPIFRTSLGIIDPVLKDELNKLPEDAWDNSEANKQLYFDLFIKTNEELDHLKSYFNIHNYSDEILQHLCIYHNDNCIHHQNSRQEYLTTLNQNKIISQKELEGALIRNRLHTKDFTFLSIKIDCMQKNSTQHNRQRK